VIEKDQEGCQLYEFDNNNEWQSVSCVRTPRLKDGKVRHMTLPIAPIPSSLGWLAFVGDGNYEKMCSNLTLF
jgi:hypothetical protein